MCARRAPTSAQRLARQRSLRVVSRIYIQSPHINVLTLCSQCIWLHLGVHLRLDSVAFHLVSIVHPLVGLRFSRSLDPASTPQASLRWCAPSPLARQAPPSCSSPPASPRARTSTTRRRRTTVGPFQFYSSHRPHELTAPFQSPSAPSAPTLVQAPALATSPPPGT